MSFFVRKHKAGYRVRPLLRAVLLACLIILCTGCEEKKPPEDRSFYVAKSVDGAEFRLGQNGEVVGRMELPTVTVDGDLKYTGEMRLYRGEELWMRVWQETDQAMIKAYLQTPTGACLLNSWQAEEGTKPHNTVDYDFFSDNSEEHNGLTVCIASPLSEDTVISVLLSVDSEGTVQLNTYVERQGTDSELQRTSENQVYRFRNNTWGDDDRVVSKSYRTAQSSQMENPRYGTADLTVDVCRDGLPVRALTWNRVGLGDEGTRYTLRCTEGTTQTLFLQTYEDAYGSVTTETAEFPGSMPYPGDERGQVRVVNGVDLSVGAVPDVRYRYDGTLEASSDVKTVLEGEIGGFTLRLLWTDELYEGDRAADTGLMEPKYRKAAFFRFYDEIAETAADVPVMRGEWTPASSIGELRDAGAMKITLQPNDMDGWDILGSGRSAEGNEAGTPVKVGSVVLGTAADPNGNQAYTGDVRISADGSEEFRMYRSYDGVDCRVMAEFAGHRWEIATCEPVGGRAPFLTVSRYVEMEDYPTPAVLRKLFYSVSLPDGTLIAQFISTTDGRIQAQLYTADGTVLCEFKFRSSSAQPGNTASVDISVTESGRTSDGAVRTEGRYPADGGTFSAVLTKERRKDAEVQGTLYTFTGTKNGNPEAEISVFVSDGDESTIEKFRLACESGTVTVQNKGGVLYIGDTCIDSYPVENPDPSFAATLIGPYYPKETVELFTTENLLVQIRVGYEYIAAQKTNDGTIIKPASARRIAWAEIHTRDCCDSWSIPLGCGSWGTAGSGHTWDININ